MWTAVLEHLDGNDSWYMVIQRARKTQMDAALFQLCAVDEADSACKEALRLAPWDRQVAIRCGTCRRPLAASEPAAF